MKRHPAVGAITRFFESDHLPEPLRSISKRCDELKEHMLETLEDDPELVVGFRKLLEAKDCFVRAAVAQGNRSRGEVPEGKPLS